MEQSEVSATRRRVLAAVGPIATSGCLGQWSRGDRQAGDNTRMETIRYADDVADASAQSLDVYPAPSEEDPGPVVVYVHGGGWVIGDKSRVHRKPEWVNGVHGGVFVSTNYRLSEVGGDGPKHPAHVRDVARATAWAIDNADEHGGDPERVFLMGHSAGAHLVALVATAEEYIQDTGHAPTSLSGVFPIDGGMYDLIWARKQDAVRRKLIDSAVGDSESRLREASPQHRLDSSDEVPPFVMAYTNGVRRTATERFAEKFREVGADPDPALVDRTDIRGGGLRSHLKVNRRIGAEGDPLTDRLDSAIRKG